MKGIWIPTDVLQHPDLNPAEKILLADIGSVKTYYKSNATIASDLGISESTITRAIAHLRELGCISAHFNGRQRTLQGAQFEQAESSNRAGRVSKVSRQRKQNDDAASPKWRDSKQDRIQDRTHHSKASVFFGEEFEPVWQEWLDERKDRGTKKYTERGEHAALAKLAKIANNNPDHAKRIIQQSIENGWAGLFPIKSNKPQGWNPEAIQADQLRNFIAEG